MRSWLSLPVLLVAVPLATACSPAPLPDEPFDRFSWYGPDVVAAYWGDEWLVANVTTGDVQFATAPPPSQPPPAEPTWPEAPDGSLQLRPVNGVLQLDTCGGGYAPLLGVELAGGTGVRRRWDKPAGDYDWDGAVWERGGNAYVWDQAAQEITTIDWDAGTWQVRSVETGEARSQSTLGPDLFGDELVLRESSGITLVDPATGNARRIDSPFGDGGSDVNENVVFFGDWDPDDGSDGLQAAVVRLSDGEAEWQVHAPYGGEGTTGYHWTAHSLVALTGGDVLRYIDGREIDPIRLRDDETVFIRGQGGFVALGFRDAEPRLVVLGADLQPVVEYPAQREIPAIAGLLPVALAGLWARLRQRA